jgi:hypothetical protein
MMSLGFNPKGASPLDLDSVQSQRPKRRAMVVFSSLKIIHPEFWPLN